MSETEDKDELLAKLLPLLANRGMVRVWAQSNAPYSNLADECRAIMSDHGNRETFRAYLQSNPLVHATVETLLSHLAMTANTKWQDTPQLVHALSRRGWHIVRWLPTFLIVDGPLGRFLKAADSPLNKLLRTQHASYPCLAQARDAFNHELFRQVRNGVGHWSFIWETSNQERLITLDWETGKQTAVVSIMEAEALHLLAFSIIEAIDTEIFKYPHV